MGEFEIEMEWPPRDGTKVLTSSRCVLFSLLALPRLFVFILSDLLKASPVSPLFGSFLLQAIVHLSGVPKDFWVVLNEDIDQVKGFLFIAWFLRAVGWSFLHCHHFGLGWHISHIGLARVCFAVFVLHVSTLCVWQAMRMSVYHQFFNALNERCINSSTPLPRHLSSVGK